MMLTLLILLLVLSLGLGIFGLRGRVAQRGVFCRRCRFDLAGIGLDDPGARCPECGHAVHDARDRRVLLRRRSRAAMVAGMLILVVALVGTGFVLSGNTAAVYARMPDRVVVGAARLGSDAALDEVMARLTKIPPISQTLREAVIEHALRVQEDRSKPWDPRLGQILLDEVTARGLSDEQMERYVLNGFRIEVYIRDRVHPGDDRIAYQIDTIGDRVGATRGGMTPYRFGARMTSFGVAGANPAYTVEPSELSGGGRLYVMSDDGTWSRLRTMMWGMGPDTSVPVGTTLPVYLACEVRLDDPDREEPIFKKPIRFEQAVAVIDPDEPIVATIENAATAQAVCGAIEIGPLYTMEQPRAQAPNYYIPMIKFAVMSDPIPESFSFAVFLRVGDSEVEIGSYVEQGPWDSALGANVQWGIAPNDQAAFDAASEIHALIVQHGSADVILRTDPTHAIGYPKIGRVIDAELVFHDVPIKIVETPDEVSNPRINQDGTHASCSED